MEPLIGSHYGQRCIRCNNILLGFEAEGDTCNDCLDKGYGPDHDDTTDEYDWQRDREEAMKRADAALLGPACPECGGDVGLDACPACAPVAAGSDDGLSPAEHRMLDAVASGAPQTDATDPDMTVLSSELGNGDLLVVWVAHKRLMVSLVGRGVATTLTRQDAPERLLPWLRKAKALRLSLATTEDDTIVSVYDPEDGGFGYAINCETPYCSEWGVCGPMASLLPAA